MRKYNENLTFTYPVTPEDTEWKHLPDRLARLKACEMDTELLKEISTHNLLRALLAHPFLIDYFAFSNPEDGLAYLKRTINSAAEFFSREDAVPVAEEICSELSDTDASDLLKRRILLHFLKKVPDTSLGDSTATIKTPAGSNVAVLLLDERLTDNEKLQINQELLTTYPNITIVSNATSTYNCHSYAWYHSSQNWNRYWLNDPSPYMIDGSYTQIPSQNHCIDGDIIYYGTSGDEHSGVLRTNVGAAPRVLSKWGQLPLVLHNINDCPYDTSNLSYYRCNYKKGRVNFINNWSIALDELCIRHRRGNKDDYEDIANFTNIPPGFVIQNGLTFYYENGFGSSFDYWWIKFTTPNGHQYKVKDNYFCNITADDDGSATLTINADDEKLNVSFSHSSSGNTSIISMT